MWRLVKEDVKTKVVFMSNLSRHTKAVNVVRFSPNGNSNNSFHVFFFCIENIHRAVSFIKTGEFLASAGDGK